MELSGAPAVHAAIGSVTVFTMSLKNIVHALGRMFAIAIALMFAAVLAACSGEPPTLGTTPLHIAAAYNSSPAVLEFLLKAGADVNAKTASGEAPLHGAAANNPSPAVLEILIKAGADPRAINNEGRPHTPWRNPRTATSCGRR